MPPMTRPQPGERDGEVADRSLGGSTGGDVSETGYRRRRPGCARGGSLAFISGRFGGWSGPAGVSRGSGPHPGRLGDVLSASAPVAAGRLAGSVVDRKRLGDARSLRRWPWWLPRHHGGLVLEPAGSETWWSRCRRRSRPWRRLGGARRRDAGLGHVGGASGCGPGAGSARPRRAWSGRPRGGSGRGSPVARDRFDRHGHGLIGGGEPGSSERGEDCSTVGRGGRRVDGRDRLCGGGLGLPPGPPRRRRCRVGRNRASRRSRWSTWSAGVSAALVVRGRVGGAGGGLLPPGRAGSARGLSGSSVAPGAFSTAPSGFGLVRTTVAGADSRGVGRQADRRVSRSPDRPTSLPVVGTACVRIFRMT